MPTAKQFLRAVFLQLLGDPSRLILGMSWIP